MSSRPGGTVNPAVSVVLPFLNPGLFFLPALQSVFAQTFSDWELLLLDDGSSDGSCEIAARIDDPRVRLIADGLNRGLSIRLNQGAQLARGEYLFRMDADDIMHPDRLGDQLAILKFSSSDTVVGTACYSIDQTSSVVGLRPAHRRRQHGFAARHSFVHPTVAASTAWFRANPYSEEPLYQRAEDAELWCRTAAHSEFKWLPQPLLFYRELGVFSISNYLAGEQALLHLICQLEDKALRRRWLRMREMVKVGLYQRLEALHLNHLIVRHRYQRLQASEIEYANFAIRSILATNVPLR
jgi:glycosyltransferase involved in cell wall biosynthesis